MSASERCIVLFYYCLGMHAHPQRSLVLYSLGRVVIVSATRSTSAVLSVMQLDSSQVLRSSGTFEVLFWTRNFFFKHTPLDGHCLAKWACAVDRGGSRSRSFRRFHASPNHLAWEHSNFRATIFRYLPQSAPGVEDERLIQDKYLGRGQEQLHIRHTPYVGLVVSRRGIMRAADLPASRRRRSGVKAEVR
ncbi:hypothetical protein BJX65DRAFT_201149 [Aspergillus insuetus]